MSMEFEAPPDEAGVRVVDAVEGRRLTLRTPEPVSPRSVPSDEADLTFPVDATVRVRTGWLRLAEVPDVYVREDGDAVAAVDPGEEVRLDGGPYEIEVNASVKLYLRIPGGARVAAGVGRVRIDLDGEQDVLIGGRSYHRRPAATVRTTGEPRDVLRAVSLFGSALKTTSSERSYPTLRGHPPALALADEPTVPDELTRPATGVRLVVRPTLRDAFVAAPLAYYLGAELVPGEDRRLVTDRGFDHDLDADDGFPAAVERALERTFLLDCLVRTEGHYQFDLHERAALADSLDLDLSALYGAPLTARVAAYHSVPYEALASQVPRWQTVAHLPADPDQVSTLPYLVDDLAVIRPPSGRELSESDVRSAVIREYVGGDARTTRGRAAEGGAAPPRGAAGGDGPGDAEPGDSGGATVVRPEPSDAVETVWFGEGIPLGASKGLAAAYPNRLDRRPSPSTIDITVVGNGGLGAAERDVAGAVYGSRAELPFDVTLRREIATDELARVLEADADFLHYVGHIDDDGFRCRDGNLGVESLATVGVDAFLLNACRSYRQGVGLVERGSVGGVVTFGEVLDDGAVAVGRAIARLLNLGFSLRAALTTARTESPTGGQYLVVGDGTVDVVQARHGAPTVYVMEDEEGGTCDLTLRAYLPAESGMGAVANPLLDAAEGYYLLPSDIGPVTVPETDLDAFLSLYRDPVRVDGELVWNDTPGSPNR